MLLLAGISVDAQIKPIKRQGSSKPKTEKSKSSASKKQSSKASTQTRSNKAQSTNETVANYENQSVSVAENTNQLDPDILAIVKNNSWTSEEKAWKLYDLGTQEIQVENWEKVVITSLEGLKIASLSDTKVALYANLARGYGELHEYDLAINACRQGLLESPNDSELRFNMNLYYFNKGEYRYAENGFSQLIDLIKNSKNDNEKELLSYSYCYLARIQKINHQYGMAETNFLKAIELCPKAYSRVIQDSSCELGEIYKEQEKYEQAVDYLKKGIENDPQRFINIKRLCQLGDCYVKLGYLKKDVEANFQNAMQSYYLSYMKGHEYVDDMKKGQEIENRSPGSLHDISDYYYLSAHYMASFIGQSGGYAEALPLYSEILDVPYHKSFLTADDYAYIYCGYSIMGDSIAANKIVYEGLEKFPNNPDLMYLMAEYIIKDRYKSIEIYKSLLKQENIYKPKVFDFATIYNNIAWAYFLSGEYSQALPYAEKSISLNSTHGYSWDTLGEIQFKLGQYNKCIESMTNCINCEDAQVRTELLREAYKFRGESYLKLGKQKEGNSDLEQAKKYQ